MADETGGLPVCADCGEPIKRRERRRESPHGPSYVAHGNPQVCIARLLVALDAAREDAARDSVDLSAALRAMTAERDEARRERDAALAVVDAARRMVTWADDAWTGRSIPEHERIVEAIRAAIAAYVKGEGR